jgi:hypothetical protein
MNPIRSLVRPAAILGGFAAAFLGSTVRADDIFVASSTTLVLEGNPFSGAFITIGACGGAAQSMTLNGDVLLIGDPNGRIYRKAPSDGFVSYAFDVPNDAQALAMHGGNLLSVGTDGTIVRVDADTGAVLATMTTFAPLTAILVSGDDVFVGSSFGIVQKGHATNGGFQFWGTCGGPVNSLAKDSTHLIVGSSNGTVYRLDLLTQAVTTFFAAPNDLQAMVVQGGDLLVAGSDARVLRLERFSGALKSTLTVPVTVSALALRAGTDPGTTYCYGIGCPCANEDPLAGCANTTGFGARLDGSGTASVSADDLEVFAFQLPPNKNGRFYMSQNSTLVPLGDGLLCAGSGGYPLFRFPFLNAGPAGALRLPPNLVSFCNQTFPAAGHLAVGATWHFQAWYRDPHGPCGAFFNTTNSYSVAFVP